MATPPPPTPSGPQCTSEEDFLAAFNLVVQALEDTRCSALPHIQKFNHQKTLYLSLCQFVGYPPDPEKQPAGPFSTNLYNIYTNIEQWAHSSEELMTKATDEQYPHLHSTIITNLGAVEIRSATANSTEHVALKYSRIEANDMSPIREGWFYKWVNKDSHPQTIELKSATTFRSKFVMITPALKGTTLSSYLRSTTPNTTLPHAKSIFTQLCHTLDYLHNHLGMVHQDIKPDNVFMYSDTSACLADFGNSATARYKQNHDSNKEHQDLIQEHDDLLKTTRSMRETMGTVIDQCGNCPSFSIPLHTFQTVFEKTPIFPLEPNVINFLDAKSNSLDNIEALPHADLRSWVDWISIELVGTPAVNEVIAQEDGSSPTAFNATPLTKANSTQSTPESQAQAQNTSTVHIKTFPEFLIDNNIPHSRDTRGNIIVEDEKQLRIDFYDAIITHLIPIFLPQTQSHSQIRLGFTPSMPPHIYSSLTPDRSKLDLVKSGTCHGTLAYMAPEIFFAQQLAYNPFPSDIYALGIILFQMAFGTYFYITPFANGIEQKAALEGGLIKYPVYFSKDFALYHERSKKYSSASCPITSFVIRSDRIAKTPAGALVCGVDQSVLSLLDRMLQWDPKKRPTIKQILHVLPALGLPD